MKILFVQPPLGAWATWGKHKVINIAHAQLAAHLRQHIKGLEIKALDCRAFDYDEKKMLAVIAEENPEMIYLGDILHTTGGLAVVFTYNQAAKTIKDKFPQVKIIVGGIFYAAAYEYVMNENPYIDFCIAGEQEESLKELVEALCGGMSDFKNIQGIAYREGTKTVVTGYRPLIQNLDTLPMPAYDLFPMDKYVGHTYWENYSETWNSRGCPAGCIFCYEWGQFDPRGKDDLGKYRFRSGKLVVDEMELLYNKFGVRSMVMMDDAYNVYRNRVEETIEECLKRDLKMNWMPLGRAPNFLRDIDLFPDLRRAGCFMALVGLEVATDEELRKIKKGITVDQVKETVAKLREAGIATVLTWMIGFEDDDKEKVINRFQIVDEIDPDIIALQYLTPVPGSPIWEEYVRRGWANIHDIRRWDFHQPVMPTHHLTVPELSSLGAYVFKEFYSREGRLQRATSNPKYSPLVGLCVRDFMENVPRFMQEAGGRSFVIKDQK